MLRNYVHDAKLCVGISTVNKLLLLRSVYLFSLTLYSNMGVLVLIRVVLCQGNI